MDYYSFTDPGGTEGRIALVGWARADSWPTKWSLVNHWDSLQSQKTNLNKTSQQSKNKNKMWTLKFKSHLKTDIPTVTNSNSTVTEQQFNRHLSMFPLLGTF